jgi:DinB superfamily
VDCRVLHYRHAMRTAVAVAATAWLAAGGLQSPAAVTERDRQRLLSHLDMTAAWLSDEVAGLGAAQTAFRRAPDTWSIAEVVEHLVLVSEIYWQNLQDAVRQKPDATHESTKKSRMTDADVLWYGIDRSWREPAIPTERAPGKLQDVRAAMETYRRNHDRLRRFIATTGEDLRAHIVQRQGCDAYQWALLISTHEQRHILQIREVKADGRFPKK